MRRIFKFFAVFTLAGIVCFGTAGLALAASVVHSGVMTVKVAEAGPDGANFTLPVPAALLNLGIGLVPRFVPQEELDRIRRELEPVRPALEALAKDLRSLPESTLVRVESRDETVTVARRGRSLVVDVDSTDGQFRVAVPADLFHRVLRALDG